MKLKDQIKERDKLDKKYDDLEQYSRKNLLKILGAPEGVHIHPYLYQKSHKRRYKTGGYRNISQTQKKNL